MTIHLHEGDLPDGLDLGAVIAVDSETMGLNPHRDRLCVVQLSAGDGDAHVVRIPLGGYDKAVHLKALLADPNRLKLFHFARFDVAAFQHWLGVETTPVWCTKIASRLCRTYTDRHGLKDLCAELLGINMSKVQQSSDWGADSLSEDQQEYAASDVLYLHQLKDVLEIRLKREGRLEIAQECFNFLPTRSRLDLIGWPEIDIFAHR